MTGMQRFVTYIYAYENGQKNSNAGYAKIETRGNNGRVDIHFATNRMVNGAGMVSFLYARNGELVYIPLGELLIENGRGMGQYTFRPEMILDTKLNFAQIDGICIRDSNEQRYMSFWKDIEGVDFSEEGFVQYSIDKQKSEQTEPIEITTESELEPAMEKTREEIERPLEEIIEDAEQESLHTMEIPMRNIFPNYTMEDIWRNMEKNRNCVQINEGLCAIQMELSDLRELPRKYWNLGNNSFLLHGFFNYRYLLFGRLPNGRWFLGVPGIYQPQEQVMASIFGFPGFLPQGKNPTTSGTPEGGNQEMQQGIWYHILED